MTRSLGFILVLVFLGLFSGCASDPPAGGAPHHPPPAVEPEIFPQADSSFLNTDAGVPVQGECLVLCEGPFILEILRSPRWGLLEWEEGTTRFTYWPDAGFSGTDAFDFQAYNEFGVSRVATVSLFVWAHPAEPPRTFSSSLDTIMGAPVAGVFLIESDGASDLVIEILAEPFSGYLELETGSVHFTYWPDEYFSGDDTIVFRASNDAGESNISTISISVWPEVWAVN